MDGIDYWRFCDELGVIQAALLIVGEDPSQSEHYVENWEPHKRPIGYTAVLRALQNAILSNRLKGQLVDRNLDYQHPDATHPINSVDWHSTRISVDDLKAWLAKKGVQRGFFFPEEPAATEYLDPKNESFAPKLAAAVQAWKAVRSDRMAKPSPRSVKQDLTKWLNLHAAEYGLTNEDGEPNKQAIEEVAKVANWNQKGGAPKTPGEPTSYEDDEMVPPF